MAEKNKNAAAPEIDEQKHIDDLVNRVSAAQKIFATYTQEQVDKIFHILASPSVSVSAISSEPVTIYDGNAPNACILLSARS